MNIKTALLVKDLTIALTYLLTDGTSTSRLTVRTVLD